MDKKEFKEFVIKSAKKHLSEGTELQNSNVVNEVKVEDNISIDPKQIKILAEEMKKVNKKMDLRNPLINPELFDIISEEKTVIKESQEEKTIIKENQKDRWQNLYSYKIPEDNNR